MENAELSKIRQFKGSVKDFKSYFDQRAGKNTNAFNTPEYQGFDNVHPTRGFSKSPHWDEINEKSINKIQNDWSKVVSDMKKTVDLWKSAEGKEKESLLKKLKDLTSTKKKLELELDKAVGITDYEFIDEAKKSMSNKELANKIKKADSILKLKLIYKSLGSGEVKDAIGLAIDNFDDDWETHIDTALELLGESVNENLIPNVGTIDDFELKELLIKNPTVKSILSDKEMNFLKQKDTDVIMHKSKRFNKIVTDGKLEFEIDLKANKLVKPLGNARKEITSYYSSNESNDNSIIESKMNRILSFNDFLK